MFQKEVVNRLIALPNTKDYGRLSVMTQWVANVQKAFDLSPGVLRHHQSHFFRSAYNTEEKVR